MSITRSRNFTAVRTVCASFSTGAEFIADDGQLLGRVPDANA